MPPYTKRNLNAVKKCNHHGIVAFIKLLAIFARNKGYNFIPCFFLSQMALQWAFS